MRHLGKSPPDRIGAENARTAPPPARLVLALVAAGLLAASWAIASASEEGAAAADRVGLSTYEEFLDTWLYTRAGDDRGLSGAEHDLARDNIAMLLDGMGLTVTLEPFEYGGATYYNVVGSKTGTVHPDRVYIVGGHYDSVSNPGADDDASGVASVLEVARIIGRYDCDCTVRFIAFDCEEVGLIGSKAYVSDHASDDIVGMVQADMVAFDPGTNLASIFGRTASDPIKTSLGASVDEYGDGLTYAIGGDVPYSDHAPFEAAGFQACLLIESAYRNNPNYHTPQDSFGQPGYLDLLFAVRMTRSIVGWVVDQAGMHNAPPTIENAPVASPNPAGIGELITFGALAVDRNGDDLAYDWDFGDDVSPAGTGERVTHEYGADGTYTASLTVSDWLDLVPAAVEVRVAKPVRLSKLDGKLRLKRPGKDRLLIRGELDLPPDFLPGGRSFRLEVGGATADFDLVAKRGGSAAIGKGKDLPGRGRVRLDYRKKDGLWRFRVKIGKRGFAEAWADEGIDVDDPGAVPVDLRIAVTVGDVPFISTGTFTYSRRSARVGRVR